MSIVDGTPSLAGFLLFIRNIMGISTAQLPDDAPSIPVAYEVSLAVVNQFLRLVPPMYSFAVYNLAGDNLINWAQDPAGAPDVPGSTPPAKYFANARNVYKIFGFIGGVIQEAHDDNTGQSMAVPDSLKNLTIANLQMLKTPWGRYYMGIAQSFGPNVWGIS